LAALAGRELRARSFVVGAQLERAAGTSWPRPAAPLQRPSAPVLRHLGACARERR